MRAPPQRGEDTERGAVLCGETRKVKNGKAAACVPRPLRGAYQLIRVTSWMTRLVFVPVRPVTS